MKILHVEAGMHLYGGALQVAFLVEGLASRGVSNVLACPTGSAVADAVGGAADAVVELPMKGDLDAGLIVRLRRAIREHRPDLVHLHSRRGADVLGGLAARSAGLPAVLSRRVDNPEPAWLASVKYRLFDRVVTISDGIRRVLMGEGVPAARLVCVPSAVDTERYRPGGDRGRLLQAFDLPADALAIGVIAQFIERKGHRDLLDALPAVIDRHPNARVLLFGQGPLNDALQAEAAALGVASFVRFAGFRDDLPELLPALDLVVHPARMEGLGVALLQAAACAVPIVAARAGGIPEVVRHERNGLLVEPRDVAGLADAVNRLCGDAGLRRAMGERGRERVLAHFSVDAMVEGNLRVYRDVLAGRSQA